MGPFRFPLVDRAMSEIETLKDEAFQRRMAAAIRVGMGVGLSSSAAPSRDRSLASADPQEMMNGELNTSDLPLVNGALSHSDSHFTPGVTYFLLSFSPMRNIH